MVFTRELDMIGPLTSSLPDLLLTEGPYAMALEVPDGRRVIDLMYASTPGAGGLFKDAKPFAGKLSRLSVAEAMVLALIWRERRVSTSRLSKMTWIHRDKLEADYLRPFERAELITRDRRSWAVGLWGEAGPAEMVAVEAKLADWREALEQAEDNRSRADLSYIALPHVDNARMSSGIQDAARGRGVGVIELEATGDAKITVKAKRAPASVCGQKWQLSIRLLGDALQSDGRWSLVSPPVRA